MTKSPPPRSLREIILERSRARTQRKRAQRELIPEDELHHATIRDKLEPLNSTSQFLNFAKCGSEEIRFRCRSCQKMHEFFYRCSLRWCPRCAWKITEERKKILRLWANQIQQPKHLVLTMRNFDVLTKRELRFFKSRLLRMRHWKIFSRVRGGCCSLEITNEGRGWHLHAHLLLDVRYLDMENISRKWARALGQKFAIVKIKDVRGTDYVNEVSKYVVEGSELAKWPAEKINEFVRAIRGIRFFNSFGSLKAAAPAIRAALEHDAREKFKCDCGARDFDFSPHAPAPASPHAYGQSLAASRLRDSLGKESQAPLLPHIEDKTTIAERFRKCDVRQGRRT